MFSLIINAATTSCLLFLSILAATKRSRSFLGYRFLAALFAGLSFDFIDEILTAAGIYNRYPWLCVAFQPVLFTFAPIIYWATFYLTSVSQKWSPRIFYHFVPYLLILLLYFKGYVFTDEDLRTLGEAAASTEYNPVDSFLVSVFFVQVAVYMYHSIRKLAKHRRSLPLFVSNLTDNDYHWLSNIMIGMCILFAVSFAEVIAGNAYQSGLFPAVYLVGFYYVGFQLVRQQDVFSFSNEQAKSLSDLVDNQSQPYSPNEGIDKAAGMAEFDEPYPDIDPEIENPVVQKKKTVSDEKIMLYHQRLLTMMETDKPYIDSEITLPKLAKMMLLNSYQTSYLINSRFNENFYNFINRYRLEDCKRMLASREFDHLSILDVAFESGFNSKTSFNTAFKKYTGCSPREFRERNRFTGGTTSTDSSSR